MEKLESFRKEIDILDEQIVNLLRRRYDVIEQVAMVKAENGLPATIPERIEEVQDNVARIAGRLGLDAAFVRELYTRLIRHSCDTEEGLIAEVKRKKAS